MICAGEGLCRLQSTLFTSWLSPPRNIMQYSPTCPTVPQLLLSQQTTLPALFRRGRCACWLALLVLLAIVAQPLSAQETTIVHKNVVLPERECQLKYAYLYSFSLLMNWPETAFNSPSAPFVIGVYGHKDYGELLDRLARSKKVRGRSIEILRLKKPKDYRSCHILYITESTSPADRDALLKRTREKPVLIAGETDGFQQTGAVVSFYLADGSVRFFLNLDEADRRQLSANARLSKVATVVRDDHSSQTSSIGGP